MKLQLLLLITLLSPLALQASNSNAEASARASSSQGTAPVAKEEKQREPEEQKIQAKAKRGDQPLKRELNDQDRKSFEDAMQFFKALQGKNELPLFESIANDDVKAIETILGAFPELIEARDQRKLLSFLIHSAGITKADAQEFKTKLPSFLNTVKRIHARYSDDTFAIQLAKATNTFAQTLGCKKKFARLVHSLHRSQELGYTPLMKAAAAGRKDLVSLFLSHEADLLAVSKGPLPIWAHTYKGNDTHLVITQGLSDNLDALSLAAIGGHIEIVDLLLKAPMDHNTLFEMIQDAIEKLIRWSPIVESTGYEDLYTAFGMPGKPTQESYKIIGLKLFRAASRAGRHLRYNEILGTILKTFDEGSHEMVHTVGLSSGRIPYCWPMEDHQPIGYFREFLDHSASGEKLGILLSVNANPASVTARLSRGLLAYLEQHPALNRIFIQRLKGYMREQQAIHEQMDQVSIALPPVLSNIVRAYASSFKLPSARIIQRITALGNVNKSDSEDK